MRARVASLAAILSTLALACDGSPAAEEGARDDAGVSAAAGAPGVGAANVDGGSTVDATTASSAADASAGFSANDAGTSQAASDAAADVASDAPTLAPEARTLLGLTSDGYVIYARTATEVDAIAITGGVPEIISASPLVHDVRVRQNVVLAGNIVWTAATGAHTFNAIGTGSNPSDFVVVGDRVALAYDDENGAPQAALSTLDLSLQTPLGPSACEITFNVVAGTLITASCVATEDGGGVVGSIDAWDVNGNATHLLSSSDPFVSATGDDPSGTLYAASGSIVASVPIAGGDPTVFFQDALDDAVYGSVQQVSLLPDHGTLALSFYEGGYSFSPVAAPALTSAPNARVPTMPVTNVDCSGPIDLFSPDGNWFFSLGCMASITDGKNELPTVIGTVADYPTVTGGTFTFDSKYALTWETLSTSFENWLAVYDLDTGESTLLAPYLLQLLWGATRTAQVSADSEIVFIDLTSGGSVLTIVDPAQPSAKVAIAAGVTTFLLDAAGTGVLYTDRFGLHYVALP